MTDLSHITPSVVAGPFDPVLAVVVLGTMFIAIIANVLAMIGWLRRR